LRWLDAAAVRRGTPFAALLPALRAMFVAGCEVPPRHVHAIGDAGTSLIMPAWQPGHCYGVKTVNIFPGNSARGLPGLHGVYTLFDANTGVPLAVLDGSELTARRTAAASALAAGFLARADASRLLLVGAGRVAALLPEALRCALPRLHEVQVWNRSQAPAARLAAKLSAQGFAARPVHDLPAAVRQAEVVSCATLSTSALVQGAWLAPGAHLDLIGSFSPAMREADAACFSRSSVFVDTEEALAKSGDLLQALAEGHFQPQQLQATLAQLCQGAHAGRSAAAQITLFKAVGSALEDLAAAQLACATSPR
jgi:ornithine cyclodeaminase/alanine dehydrogenase-like protein (mu-crystallin family)